MQRKRRSAEQWKQIIEDWKNSGLSVSRFCREGKLPSSAFYRWKTKLRQQETQQQNPFIQVDWTGAKDATLELSLNTGHVFRFAETTDKKALVSILTAIKEVGLC